MRHKDDRSPLNAPSTACTKVPPPEVHSQYQQPQNKRAQRSPYHVTIWIVNFRDSLLVQL